MISRFVQILSMFCAVLLLPALCPPGARSQPHAMTPEDLTRGSDIVAVGKVKELKSEWTPGKRAIVTRVTLDVNECLKGNAGHTMTVLVPGGEVDGVGEWYSHTPRFKQDEDIVVFAKRQGPSELCVTGGETGKLVVTHDPTTGKRLVAGGLDLDQFKKRVTESR